MRTLQLFSSFHVHPRLDSTRLWNVIHLASMARRLLQPSKCRDHYELLFCHCASEGAQPFAFPLLKYYLNMSKATEKAWAQNRWRNDVGAESERHLITSGEPRWRRQKGERETFRCLHRENICKLLFVSVNKHAPHHQRGIAWRNFPFFSSKAGPEEDESQSLLYPHRCDGIESEPTAKAARARRMMTGNYQRTSQSRAEKKARKIILPSGDRSSPNNLIMRWRCWLSYVYVCSCPFAEDAQLGSRCHSLIHSWETSIQPKANRAIQVLAEKKDF